MSTQTHYFAQPTLNNSTYYQDWENYYNYVSSNLYPIPVGFPTHGNMYHNSAFMGAGYTPFMDPSLWEFYASVTNNIGYSSATELIDHVLVTTDYSEAYLRDLYAAASNTIAYNSYVAASELSNDAHAIAGLDQMFDTMVNLNRISFASGHSALPSDNTSFLDLGDNVREGNEDGAGRGKELFIKKCMRTRTYCGATTKVETNSNEKVISADDEGEMCVICLSEFMNGEVVGTLNCKHEFHAGCIEKWLLKGKITCPICRASVLPS